MSRQRPSGRAAPAVLGALTLAAGLAGFAAAESTSPSPASLFPREADVSVERDGLARLSLPADVLAACRPDLSDLRLFDMSGAEIPFVVDAAAGPVAATVERRIVPRVVDVRRETVPRDKRAALRRETTVLALPASREPGAGWRLVVEPAAHELVARVRVETLDEDGAATTLVDDGAIFRGIGPRHVERTAVPLPRFDADLLRVLVESDGAGWLDPGFRLERDDTIAGAEPASVPLEQVARHEEPGRTIVDLARPRGLVPDTLRVDSRTATYDRAVVVWDEGPGATSTPLGRGEIFRLPALVPVGDDGLTVQPAFGDRLRIVIDRGDSPPLEALRFVAVVRRPSLIFPARRDEDGRWAAVLRFGGGRAHRPRYDIAGLLPGAGEVATGRRAAAAALLHDPAIVSQATLGRLRDNPAYDGAPALAFAMRPAAEIDARRYSHRRRLDVPEAPEGLSSLRLTAGDLATLRDDLGDLRVADDRSRQWPYLVERDAATVFADAAVDRPRSDDGTSHYRLSLPVTPIAFDRLLLDTDAAYFDRPFRLEARTGDGPPRALAAGRLTRPVDDPRPVAVDVPPTRCDAVELIVDDGDDAPLDLQRAQLRLSLPVLYLTAPAGRYELLLGAPDETSPRYDLERVRDVVLTARAVAIDAGPLEGNEAYSIGSRLLGRGLGATALMWIALVAAVLALVGLSLRLARREAGAGDDRPPDR